MLEVQCSGSPYDIGQQHGSAAKQKVHGSIEFYREFFMERTRLSWAEVCEVALQFMPMLTASWPDYVEEIKGIAAGAEVPFESILALNVRTEIAYGMVSDGCTAFSWKTNDASFLAQNWDWRNEQRPNVVKMRIEQRSKPVIHMMTEAGIIGKIGLNSAGVGVTLNAVQAKGVNFQALPTHLALRTVLNSSSRQEAYDTLMRTGVASACHIIMADAATGAVGLECSAYDTVRLDMNEYGIYAHSNHFIRPHAMESKIMMPDSPMRLKRINELLKSSGSNPTMEKLTELLKDKSGYPTAICRGPTEKSSMETLFSIVMDLGQRYAVVKIGQPTDDGEQFELRP